MHHDVLLLYINSHVCLIAFALKTKWLLIAYNERLIYELNANVYFELINSTSI